MSPREHLPRKVALLFLAALAVVACSAGLAHAAEYKIEGKSFAELKIEQEEFEETATSEFITFTIPPGARVNCRLSRVTSPTGLFLAFNLFTPNSHRLIVGTMCTVLDAMNNELPCTVVEPFDIKVLATIVVQGGKNYELMEGSEKGTLGTLKLEGAECSLPKTLSVTGTLGAETEAGERVEQPRTYSSEINKLLGAKLFFGTKEVGISGKTVVTLVGKNKGKKWGIS